MSETQTFASVTKLKKFGVDINLTNIYKTSDYDGAMALCDDPDRSAIPPKFINVPNIDELKALIGQADALFSEEPGEPPLPHPKDLDSKITNPFHPQVCAALNTYVYGNSQSVQDWKEVINELRFPMELAVYGAGEVIVSPGKPLILEGTNKKPIAFVCVKLTIEPGGRVTVKGPGAAVVDNMLAVKGPGMGVTAEPSNWVCVGGNGGEGGVGGNGTEGSNGGKGSNATESGKSGCNEAQKGGDGGEGANATEGGRGGDGASPDEFSVNVDVLEGAYTVGSVGGNGGKGGKGGNGGKGGDGGDGGNSCKHCGTGARGDGGKGGNAARGGAGGNGGNGAKVYINFKYGSPTFGISPLKADGGKGGDAGTPGKGGDGKKGGKGGDSANAGDGGKGGQPGKIFINGKQIGA